MAKMAALQNDDTEFTKIVFMGGDKQSSFDTIGQNVIVFGSGGKHDHGSSKIKLKNIVDYKWEIKNYVGRLISIHIDGNYVAYAIKVNGKDGKAEGMVRVVNPLTGQRALIRGKTNEVLDLQFAHLKSQILLASIEETALHIHRIETVGDNIICTLVLKIDDPIVGHVPKYDKISWCPFITENDTENENDGRLIVWTRGSAYQCFNINTIVEQYGIGAHQATDIVDGTLKHEENSMITGATLSPDGTTIAITFEDGNIRFYQVYFHSEEESPRLLHQWIPHAGKSVTSLFFLDDYTKLNADTSLWKHAITTSENNTEIKVWCCATWKCIQTIVFKDPKENKLFFKAEIDPTSSYLILTDTVGRGLYVLQLMQTTDEDDDDNDDDGNNENKKPINTEHKLSAYIKSITEFPLQSSILSFGILNATVRKYKSAYNDMYLLEDADDYDEDNASNYCIVIHLYIVQPKSVQACHVLYQPTYIQMPTEKIRLPIKSESESENLDDKNNGIDEKSSDNDNTNDLLINTLSSNTNTNAATKISPALIKSENNLSHQSVHSVSGKPLNLMTPDSFHSSGKITPEGVSNEVYNALRMLAAEKSNDTANIFQMVKSNKEIEEIEHMKYAQQSGNGMPIVSGGSSPSREVQEILSLKETDCLNDYYNDSIDIQDDTDGSGNNADGDAIDTNDVDGNGDDDEKNSNQDDDDTYTLTKVNNVPTMNKSKTNDWPNAPDIGGHAFQSTQQSTNNSLININNKLDRMMEIIQSQNCRISELQNEIITLKHSGGGGTAAAAAVHVDNNRNSELLIAKVVEDYLGRCERDHNKRLEAFFAQKDNQTREIRESILRGVPPIICTNLSGQLSTLLVNEMKNILYPQINNKLDSIKSQIQTDVAQKLTISDHVIKENIINVCKSKDTMEIFGNSVALGVRSGLQQTYIDALKKIILPAYEKANAELFKQLHETFHNGTIAFGEKLNTYTKMYEPIHNEILNLMRAVPDQLRTLNDATVNSCTQRVTNEVNKDLKVLQSNLLKILKDNIKFEIKKGFESQAASLEDSVIMAVRSQAQTPAPSIYDVQEQIKLLLQQGQINKAFHQALLANDLHLVEYALERADYSHVFNPCPLEQTVLLSLIQQISADMSRHNELKQKYLSDAIVNLNLRDSITKEHAPKVLKELLMNCQNYITANQHLALSSNVRMLMMAVQGFGIQLS